jgi:hypothetical protein
VVRDVCALLVLACGCQFRVAGWEIPGGHSDAAANPLPYDAAMLAPPTDLARNGNVPSSDMSTPHFQLDLSRPDLSSPFCTEASLVACWQFDDARDGTGNHNDLTLTGGAATVVGGYRGDALTVPTGGLAHVAHNTTFDVAHVTVEAWIKPSALPTAGARAGIFDEDGQYGVFIYPPGILTCAMASDASSPSNTIIVGVWQHVACTYDQMTVRVYYNGVEVASQPATTALPTMSPNGVSVGSNSPSGDELAGLVDEVRVFSIARTAAEICAAAGGNGC